MGSATRRLRALLTGGDADRAIPVLVLVLGLVVSGIVFVQLQRAQHQEREASFAQEVRRFADAFQGTVTRHEDALRSTSALLAASRQVNRAEFQAFVDGLDLPRRYPGLDGVGLVRPVQHAQRDAYLDERRSEGDANFTVEPPGNRSAYWVLTYQSGSSAPPEAELLPLGLDLRTRAPLRALLREARDGGEAAATQVGADGLEDGAALVALPIYSNGTEPGTIQGRRQALEAWVVGYASPSTLLTVTPSTPGAVGVRLFQSPPPNGTLLARTSGDLPVERAREAGFLRTETLEAFGNRWALQFVPRSESVYLAPPPTPWLVLGGSVLVTVLVGALVWSVSWSEARARRRVEAATRDLREAQRVAQVGSWEWEIQSNTLSWSDEQYRLLGREPGDPPDPGFDTFLEEVHPEDRDRVDDLVTRAVEQREFTPFEYRVEEPDGTVRWLEARGTVEVEGGEAVRLRGTNLDVTDRKALEDELRDREERLREAQRMADLGLVEAAPGPGEDVWSPGLYQILGIEPGEVEPTLEGYLERVHPEDREDLAEAGRAALEGGEEPSLSYRIVRPDGEVRHVDTRFRVEEKEDPDDRTVYVTVLDVTERARLERELREAKEAAEAADEAKSRFLATMSHEIRTPMNSILGLTELLRDSDLTEEQEGYLESVHASGEHLLELIDDILDFSKIEAGELALESRAFDLRGTVEEALRMVAPQAGPKDLELAYRYSEDVPEAIHGDPQRVRQVLVNLLSNAVKFTHEGEVVVRVEVLDDGPVATSGDEVPVQFEVEDTGIGIEEDAVEDLFDPFTQAESSPDREHQGTGLGLPISYRLVEMMGGTMEAEGTPGEGSTFRFVLPAEPAERPETRSWKSRPASLEGSRLLVVDDNETSREIVTQLADRWGMDWVAAESADDALDRMREGEEVDVAVVDYSMPGATGVELVGRLREDPDLEDLPVVVLTSMPEAEHEVREAEVEVVDVIVKPVEPSDLFDSLRAALGERAPHPEDEGTGFDEGLGERLDLRVLVVEDDPVNREVVQRMLTRLGFEPDAARDGEEAVRRVREGDYDVAFMDIQMPGTDGYEATRRIREEIPVDDQPRIVALTAHAGTQDRQRALEAGMDDYLAKPVDAQGLVDALERSASAGSGGDAD